MDPHFEERQGDGRSCVNDSASFAVPATVDVKASGSIEGGPVMPAKSKGSIFQSRNEPEGDV